jgi:hypothetical protein
MVVINCYTHTPVKILKSHQEKVLSSKSEEEPSRLVIVVEKAFCAVSDTANHSFLSQLVTHIAHKERIKVRVFFIVIYIILFCVFIEFYMVYNNQ